MLILVGRGLVELVASDAGPGDLALGLAMAVLVAAAVVNARVSGIEAERLNSGVESFTSILRALSRSVSPDAVVNSIVHELGAATEADHVAVVRLRPGSSVLDVTFVSMLPGAPTSNMVMPVRQLGPIETNRLRDMPLARPGDGSIQAAGGDAVSVWHAGHEVGLDIVDSTSIRGGASARRRSPSAADDEAKARELADRIAYRLRDAYGLRYTLAAPLCRGSSVVGAIVLSRRADERVARGCATPAQQRRSRGLGCAGPRLFASGRRVGGSAPTS